MKSIVFLAFLLFIGMAPAMAQGDYKEMQQLLLQLSRFSNVSYDYLLKINSENRQDSISGSVKIFDAAFLNTSKEAIIYQDEHWYYKADLERKTVLISNLDKLPKGKKEKQLNQAALMTKMFDSTLLKYAHFLIRNEGEMSDVTITFDKDAADIKKIWFRYNVGKNELTNYEVTMDIVYDYDEETEEKWTMEQIIRIKNIQQIASSASNYRAELFTDSKGIVQLNKYKDFKLHYVK